MNIAAKTAKSKSKCAKNLIEGSEKNTEIYEGAISN